MPESAKKKNELEEAVVTQGESAKIEKRQQTRWCFRDQLVEKLKHTKHAE